MAQWKQQLTLAVLLAVTGLVLLACAAPAPTPTATAKPAVAPTPTKAPAPTPTKVAIRFEGGKLQPLPDGYPSKPINLYTGKVGSGHEVFLRQLLKAAEPLSPVPLVVKNVSGGTIEYFQAARDGDKTGYAFPTTSASIIFENYIYGENLILGKDYKPVMIVSSTDLALVVRADAPWKNLKELLDYAKANPGLRAGVTPPGSLNHLVCEWLARDAGIKWTCVPHDSAGDVVRTVLAGDLPIGFGVLSSADPQIDAGKMRVIGTASTDKLLKYPDVSRYTDLGSKVKLDQFRGFLAPGEVPNLRVEWLSALLAKAVQDPEFRKWSDSVAERVVAWEREKAEAVFKELDPVADWLTKELGMRP